MPLVLLEKECGLKCRSRKHVQEILSLISRGGLREFQAYSNLCYNWAKHSDIFGRTALHVAASYGKTEILKWLLEERLIDLTLKDLESGYTALHRAVLYGQLTCARLLVQYNADVHVRDVEGLGPLDIAMLDRPPHVLYTVKEPNEVYTWGENNNSTLGHSSPHKRTSPEAVDLFKKMGVSIKQIVLCKYHCVFLTQFGQVYTCGHGPGGRLGHGDQHTILVPRLLESVKEYTCLEVAAATDHTVIRMEGGSVFTFGLNLYHQLGQSPMVENSPLPKQMNLKPLKGKSISGVCVGRFHSVVWTPDSVFTVGLNAGQLGHQKGEKFLSQLRQVSYLRHTDIGIARVACSDAATVCLTTKGDIFVLHEYQCRKIVSKEQDIDKVLVTGGNLDHSVAAGILTEKGGEELSVMMKNESGQLFLWRSSDPNFKKCHFALKRQLAVSDVAMTTSCLIFSTNRGEAFMGYLSNKKISPSNNKEIETKQVKELVKECGDGFGQTRLHDLLLKEGVEEVQVRRLPVVHRAVIVSSDRKGRNFAIIQALPNSCMSEFPSVTSSEMNEQFSRLLGEADSEDNIHDAIIQVGNKSWPVHKYIVAMRSDMFKNMVTVSASQKGEMLNLKVDSTSPEIMDQLITFMYTDMCDFLQPGFRIKQSQGSEKDNSQQHEKHPRSVQDTDNIDDLIATKGLSAFQVQEKRNLLKNKKKEVVKAHPEATENNVHHPQNYVKMLQDAARKFGVKGLSKRLDAVKCSSGVIMSQGKPLAKPKVKFDRTKLPELYDVKIKTEGGHEIQCHKCVLVSRLEYFHSMLATGWIETFNTTTLTLPVAGDVLEVLVDYLYTDEACQLRDCTDEELLCNALIVSDQLLAWRLKEMCEVALANNIAFKNVSELLEFATIYNAEQLKLSCLQFISINLSAMIEGRYLDVLSQETMNELTAYYRSIIPSMAYRVLTPTTEGPSQAYIDDLVAEFEGLNMDSSSHHSNEYALARKGKQQRKRNKSRKLSGGETLDKNLEVEIREVETRLPSLERTLSVGSDVSGKSEDNFLAVVEEINKQAEENEKKLASAMEKAKQMKWRPMNSVPVPTAIPPTQPEDIPKWTASYKSLVWTGNSKRADSVVEVAPVASSPKSVSSSVLATSPTSFRDIMQQESGSAEKKKTAFSGRVSWKDVKKQQSKETKDKQQKPIIVEASDKPVVNTSSPKVPWSAVGGAVKSFRDLMNEDKHAEPPSVVSMSSIVAVPRSRTPTASSTSISGTLGKSPPSGSASWRLPIPIGRSTPAPSPDVAKLSTSLPTELENAWHRRATLASSPPSQTPIAALDFSAILRDEKEKSETLVRTIQKPLALIQLEEKAMCELLAHYAAGKESDRYITVERVSKQMAAPLWHRGQKQPGTGHL
ncbi:hypothetical protein BsWGS_12870 [Bradybaena similaris]